MESWSHPVLGTFHLGFADIWVTTIRSSAFNAFEKNTAELWLFATHIGPGVSGPPTGASVDFAVQILERLPELIPQCIEALWGDLTGTGELNSGSWWRGGLDEMFRNSVTEMEDLHSELSPKKIEVGSRSWRDATPTGWIDFKGVVRR